eukprot:SAG31_NODE_3183_length_4581_cov_1.629183_1_plen_142_part_00
MPNHARAGLRAARPGSMYHNNYFRAVKACFPSEGDGARRLRGAMQNSDDAYLEDVVSVVALQLTPTSIGRLSCCSKRLRIALDRDVWVWRHLCDSILNGQLSGEARRDRSLQHAKGTFDLGLRVLQLLRRQAYLDMEAAGR